MTVDHVAKHENVQVIYCRGRLILGETNELRDAALVAIRDTGQVVIHLGNVSNIDSSGLGLLASLCVSARKVSGDVKLVAPSTQVAESLKITKLGRVLDIYPTEQAALEALTTIPSARRAPGQPSRGKTPVGSVR